MVTMADEQKQPLSLFIAAPDAARVLGVTPQTIRMLVRKGDLKGGNVGKRVMVSRESFDEYVKQRLQGTTLSE